MAARRLKIEDYTVGCIYALPVELAAAVESLDEKHLPLLQDPTDNNSYTFGRIGEHNAVLACLPAGQKGANSAASVATQMRSKFKSIRFGLMVGIGGGVPSDKSDIRLGDVVISQPSGQFGGVVQYDFGKIGMGRHFVRTGTLNSPPQVLLTALSTLQANDIRGKLSLSKHLSTIIQRLPKFAYPGAAHDELYKASFNHLGGSICHNCNKQELVERDVRESPDVVLHYGTIASSNQVVKDAVTRDSLSSELGGVLCFEMEAAGLMNSFPCLVIRGICDYADSHKHDEWQPYAAATATACAKELLHLVSPIQIASLPTISGQAGQSGSWTSWLPTYAGGIVINLAAVGLGILLSGGRRHDDRDNIQVIEYDEPYIGARDGEFSTWISTPMSLIRGLKKSSRRYISVFRNKSPALGLRINVLRLAFVAQRFRKRGHGRHDIAVLAYHKRVGT